MNVIGFWGPLDFQFQIPEFVIKIITGANLNLASQYDAFRVSGFGAKERERGKEKFSCFVFCAESLFVLACVLSFEV